MNRSEEIQVCDIDSPYRSAVEFQIFPNLDNMVTKEQMAKLDEELAEKYQKPQASWRQDIMPSSCSGKTHLAFIMFRMDALSSVHGRILFSTTPYLVQCRPYPVHIMVAIPPGRTILCFQALLAKRKSHPAKWQADSLGMNSRP